MDPNGDPFINGQRNKVLGNSVYPSQKKKD